MRKHKRTQSKFATNSSSPKQIVNSWQFWTGKNKLSIKSNKSKKSNQIFETKYQLLINKHESVGLKHFGHPKAFIEYSVHMNDIF